MEDLIKEYSVEDYRKGLLEVYLECVSAVEEGNYTIDSFRGLIDELQSLAQGFDEYKIVSGGKEYVFNELKVFEWALDMSIYALSRAVSVGDDVDLNWGKSLLVMKDNCFGLDEGGEGVVSQGDLLRFIEAKLEQDELLSIYADLRVQFEALNEGDGDILREDIRSFMGKLNSFLDGNTGAYFDEQFLDGVKQFEGVLLSDLTEDIEGYYGEYFGRQKLLEADRSEHMEEVAGLMNKIIDKQQPHGLSELDAEVYSELCFIEQVLQRPKLFSRLLNVIDTYGDGLESITDRVGIYSECLKAYECEELRLIGFNNSGFDLPYFEYRYLGEQQLRNLYGVLSVYARYGGAPYLNYIAVCKRLLDLGFGDELGLSEEFVEQEFAAAVGELDERLNNESVVGEGRVYALLQKKALGGFTEEDMKVLETEFIELLESEGKKFDAYMTLDGPFSEDEVFELQNIAVRFCDAFNISIDGGDFHRKFGSNAKYLAALLVKKDWCDSEVLSIGETRYSLVSFAERVAEFEEHLEECKRNGVQLVDRSLDSHSTKVYNVIVDGGGDWRYISNKAFVVFIKALIDTQLRVYGPDEELPEVLYQVSLFEQIIELPEMIRKELIAEGVDPEICDEINRLLRIKRDALGIPLDKSEENFLSTELDLEDDLPLDGDELSEGQLKAVASEFELLISQLSDGGDVKEVEISEDFEIAVAADGEEF